MRAVAALLAITDAGINKQILYKDFNIGSLHRC